MPNIVRNIKVLRLAPAQAADKPVNVLLVGVLMVGMLLIGCSLVVFSLGTLVGVGLQPSIKRRGGAALSARMELPREAVRQRADRAEAGAGERRERICARDRLTGL